MTGAARRRDRHIDGPAAWAGVIAVMVVAFTTVTLVAGVPPIVTAVAPVNSCP